MAAGPPPGALRIRPEARADAPAIRRVNELAFGGAAEAEIVEALRGAGAVTLSLVADLGGEIVGHILFSPARVESARGEVQAVGLAPMAVLPDHQRRGVGTALVRAGLEWLRQRGHGAVIVLGHPTYYPRFGFVPASRFGVRWERPCPGEAFQALELVPGALRTGGVARFRPELTPS